MKSKEKLELKHVLAHCKADWFDTGCPDDPIIQIESIDVVRNKIWDKDGNDIPFSEIKPILHPLSDLTKEIEHNGEKFVPVEKLREIACLYNSDRDLRFYDGDFIYTTDELKIDRFGNIDWYDVDRVCQNQYQLFQKLLEWHFDVFGLIEKGLAISIHDVNSNK